MKKLLLDGERIPDRDSLHTTLKRVLNFPDYYGNNLDALHDCLTDISEEVMVYINLQTLHENLGGYADSLLEVMRASASENKWLHITVIE
ncbi:MAG: barstar family protein [Oscillospiraceae bacterium]